MLLKKGFQSLSVRLIITIYFERAYLEFCSLAELSLLSKLCVSRVFILKCKKDKISVPQALCPTCLCLCWTSSTNRQMTLKKIKN